MRRPPFPLVVALSALFGGQAGATAATAPGRTPVVVELYTAQGCAGCPEADRLVSELGARRGVLALTLPVDYWDYLGWADTSAEPGFTKRQRAYADRLKVREIYTPEVIVDGRKEAGGSTLDKAALDALVHGGVRDFVDGPQVRWMHGGARVRVSAGRKAVARADVWLMRYDPKAESVRVKAGDNKGQVMVRRYVVHALTRLGGYGGGVRSYALPDSTGDPLSSVVLVQGVRGGKIYGAGQD